MSKKTVLRSQAGVRLERLNISAEGGSDAPRYRLSESRRGNRIIRDEDEAHRAFARAVAARLQERSSVAETAPTAAGF